MEDVIEVSLDIDELNDIIFYEGKAFVPYEVGNVVNIPGKKVIHTDDLMSLLHEVVAEVRAQEARSTCDECSLHSNGLHCKRYAFLSYHTAGRL